jgi:hypothetical protein
MGPQRYRRMKKALAGPSVNRRFLARTDCYVLRLSKEWTPAGAPCVLRHERLAMLAEG